MYINVIQFVKFCLKQIINFLQQHLGMHVWNYEKKKKYFVILHTSFLSVQNYYINPSLLIF